MKEMEKELEDILDDYIAEVVGLVLDEKDLEGLDLIKEEMEKLGVDSLWILGTKDFKTFKCVVCGRPIDERFSSHVSHRRENISFGFLMFLCKKHTVELARKGEKFIPEIEKALRRAIMSKDFAVVVKKERIEGL